MLYEKLETLCKERGISIAKLERDCCIGNATVRRWDKAFPRIDTLKKVADYLGSGIEK
ncbi:MAG: helix-turn-helix transcriptional regulator [Lachnospiraceae bacterium]|nr:helix-turn-helix transcriptional regulator [Lachnospiraceae bacterium]